MKRLIIYANRVLHRDSKVVISSDISYTDNFEAYTVGTINGQGNWSTILGDHIIRDTGSNNVVVPDLLGGRSCASIDLGAISNDQYAEIELNALGTSGQGLVGVAVRCSGSGGTISCYGIYINSSFSRLFKYVNGSYSSLDTGGGANVGDIIKISSVGTTITVLLNGLPTEIGNAAGETTDSSISSGDVGIFGYDNALISEADNFEGGEII